MRRLSAAFLSALLAFLGLSATVQPHPAPPTSTGAWQVTFDDSLQGMLRGLWTRRNVPRVFLRTPTPTADPAIPLEVATSLAGARAFQIDVDLDHDGRFQGDGELGYAAGRFDAAGRGNVRLHGLIHGRYQARVRVNRAGRDVVSAVRDFEVLPPPRQALPVSFEPNQGQADSAVLFLGRTQNQTVFITAKETTVVMTHGSSNPRNLRNSPPPPETHA